MASLQPMKKGYRIQFYLESKRPTWRLPYLGKREAELYKHNLEELVLCNKYGRAYPAWLEFWIEKLNAEEVKFLSELGLLRIKRRRVGEFVDDIIKKFYRKKAPNTLRNMNQVAGYMKEGLGADKYIDEITVGDCELWKSELIDEGHSTAYITNILSKSSTILNKAVKFELIKRNPFDGITKGTYVNSARCFYVERSTIDQLYSVCDSYMKAIVDLSRYAGLRCPTDIVSLKIESLNFENRTIVQWRQKTKRYVAIPMLPQVESSLLKVLDYAQPGQEYVLPNRFRTGSDSKVSSTIKRLIIRAGLEPWPKLTNNLRLSLGVDWKLQGIPESTIAKWLDHNEKIHLEHYNIIVDKEFLLALGEFPYENLKTASPQKK